MRTLVHLRQPALASVAQTLTPDQRVAYASQVRAAQDGVIAQIEAEGGQVMGRLTTLSSGIVALIPGNRAPHLARLPQVERLTLIQDYQMDLSESVPEIGADIVQIAGITGTGVIVAVIDSGVDYSHKALGGPGTVLDWYDAYYGDNPDCFDTQPHCAYSLPPDPSYVGPDAPKVAGGYDWVGELWPDGPVIPDSNPIDAQGHGTHVADIIAGFGYPAGHNADGDYPAQGVGVAPGAKIWALKVCSAINTSCNGAALLLALDDAADLDNDPATIDPADIVNLSLGSTYGQPEDDVVALVNQLAAYGVIVVASAGNANDSPYIVGQPSTADGAISVAQSAMPSFGRYPLQVLQPEAIAGFLTSAIWQTWSVKPTVSGALTGTVVYGDGSGGDVDGCNPFTTA